MSASNGACGESLLMRQSWSEKIRCSLIAMNKVQPGRAVTGPWPRQVQAVWRVLPTSVQESAAGPYNQQRIPPIQQPENQHECNSEVGSWGRTRARS